MNGCLLTKLGNIVPLRASRNNKIFYTEDDKESYMISFKEPIDDIDINKKLISMDLLEDISINCIIKGDILKCIIYNDFKENIFTVITHSNMVFTYLDGSMYKRKLEVDYETDWYSL